jgi:hypothetical protein
MRRVHHEFAYQARELAAQVEGILGDPPNQKNYDQMVQALVSEYADGGGIEDVNLLAFALVDHIRFTNPKGLMAETRDYDRGSPDKVFALAGCEGEEPGRMYAQVTANFPDLARKAILTAFLHKHPKQWDEEDHSLDALAEGDEGDEDQEEGYVSEDFAQIFDQEE